MIIFNPGHVVGFLNEMIYDDYLSLVTSKFEQATN